jgi:hypothetical protein
MNNAYGIIIAYTLFVAVATLCKPDFLGGNSFLDSLVGPELLSLLAVILSITFASVANIHLALNRIIRRAFGDVHEGQEAARPSREQINSNAWLLFYAFLVCAAALFLKSLAPDSDTIKSAMNGVAIGSLLVNVLVFRDIYSTIFQLAESDLAVKGAEPPELDPDSPGAEEDGS